MKKSTHTHKWFFRVVWERFCLCVFFLSCSSFSFSLGSIVMIPNWMVKNRVEKSIFCTNPKRMFWIPSSTYWTGPAPKRDTNLWQPNLLVWSALLRFALFMCRHRRSLWLIILYGYQVWEEKIARISSYKLFNFIVKCETCSVQCLCAEHESIANAAITFIRIVFIMKYVGIFLSLTHPWTLVPKSVREVEMLATCATCSFACTKCPDLSKNKIQQQQEQHQQKMKEQKKKYNAKPHSPYQQL